MIHPIYKIVKVAIVRPYVIDVVFDDGTKRRVDLEPLLRGEMFGALKDERMFQRVTVDQEVGTIQWPNGADFDPALIYHWDEHVEELARRAQEWELD